MPLQMPVPQQKFLEPTEMIPAKPTWGGTVGKRQKFFGWVYPERYTRASQPFLGLSWQGGTLEREEAEFLESTVAAVGGMGARGSCSWKAPLRSTR